MSFSVLVLSLLLVNAEASSSRLGPDPASGGQAYEQTGCGLLSNITSNIEGYKVQPEQSYHSGVLLCGTFKVLAADELSVLQKVAELSQGCFDVTVTGQNIQLGYLDMPLLTTTTDTIKTHEVNGQSVQTKSTAVTKRFVCAIGPDALIEEPFKDLF